MSNDHLNKLRRLRALQELSRVAPIPMGERGLLNALINDRELSPTIEKVRDSLQYLADQGLVHLIQKDGYDWMAASITDDGLMWLESPGDHGLDIYNPDYQPPELPAIATGRTSKISKLPPETRAWLEQQLIDRQFTGYSELTELLQQQGLEIKRSSLGRYAKRLKARVAKYQEKAEMVKSLAQVFDEEADDMMQGAYGLGVTAIIDAIEDGEYSTGKESLSSLVKSLPGLGRGLSEVEKRKIEKAARQQALEEAASAVEQAAIQKGQTAEDAQFWRGKVLGVQ